MATTHKDVEDKIIRLTINFDKDTAILIKNSEKHEKIEALAKANGIPADEVIQCFDTRNNILCLNPTLNWTMYYNYLDYLNSVYREWLSYGYFDCGMLPYVMLPNIPTTRRTDSIINMLNNWAKNAEVPTKVVPAVSFLKYSYKGSFGTDSWIFREDFIKVFNMIEEMTGYIGYTLDSIDDPRCALTSLVKAFRDKELDPNFK